MKPRLICSVILSVIGLFNLEHLFDRRNCSTLAILYKILNNKIYTSFVVEQISCLISRQNSGSNVLIQSLINEMKISLTLFCSFVILITII